MDKAFNEGQNLWNQNDFQRALEQFSEALEADLNNQNTVPQLYLWICKCYLKVLQLTFISSRK